MHSVVAVGAVTVGINVTVRKAELRELGLVPGSYSEPSVARMAEIRQALTAWRGSLPEPRNGGSVGNSANFIARAGVSCGLMGVGGNDAFGRTFVANCERASLAFLSELEEGAVTGYDFYLQDEDGARTIVLTHGANRLLSPARIQTDAIQGAELLLLDGGALAFGPQAEAALAHCIQVAEQANVPFVLTLASTQIVTEYRAFFDAFAPKAQWVAGNCEQTAVLVNLNPKASLNDVRNELTKLPINAIVTLDTAGAFAKFGEETVLMPTKVIDAVDATGAGDGFLGAFLGARQKGHTVRQALAVGNVVAGEVIQHDSARLPPSVDVPTLLQKAIRIAENLAD